MMSKSTFLLFGILAIALLMLPLPHQGSIINVIFPEAFGQIPVLNVTSQLDAPCAGSPSEVLPNKPLCSCFELGTCKLFESPLDAMLEPFFASFGGQFFLVIVWGMIIGVIWLRTSSTMITGVVGLGIASIFIFNEKTILVGIVLLGAAIGIVVYQLYKQRLDFPTN